MEARTGEKIGWTAGWIGGFVWVFALSLVFLVQHRIEQGVVGVSLAAVSVLVVVFVAPWRFPQTPYWKLMLAPYGLFLGCVAWAVWSYGGLRAGGWNWWDFLWLLFLLMPLGSLHKRTWADSGASPAPLEDAVMPRC
jgi:hypothetical protein